MCWGHICALFQFVNGGGLGTILLITKSTVPTLFYGPDFKVSSNHPDSLVKALLCVGGGGGWVELVREARSTH